MDHPIIPMPPDLPIHPTGEQWQAIAHGVYAVAKYVRTWLGPIDTLPDRDEFTADIATLNSLADFMLEIHLPQSGHAYFCCGDTVYDQTVASLSLAARRAISDKVWNPVVGYCDECCSAKSFDSARQRDLWQMFHAHMDEAAC